MRRGHEYFVRITSAYHFLQTVMCQIKFTSPRFQGRLWLADSDSNNLSKVGVGTPGESLIFTLPIYRESRQRLLRFGKAEGQSPFI